MRSPHISLGHVAPFGNACCSSLLTALGAAWLGRLTPPLWCRAAGTLESAKGGGSPSESFKRKSEKPPTLQAVLSAGATSGRVITALKTNPKERTLAHLKLITRVTSNTKFFMSLEPADVESLSMRFRYQLAHPNAVLMQTGDEADKFYLVLGGQLQVLVNGEVVAEKRPGDSFGEMALLSRERRSADVIAMQMCDLAVLHRSDYLEIVQSKQNSENARKLTLLEANPIFNCLTAAQKASVRPPLRP